MAIDKIKFLDYIGDIKDNAIILAKLKNAATKKAFIAKEEDSIKKKENEFKTAGKSYGINILEENNNNQNVIKIYKDYMEEYKSVLENLAEIYLACYQDGNIELVNIQMQIVQNLKELRVFKDVKMGIIQKLSVDKKAKIEYIESMIECRKKEIKSISEDSKEKIKNNEASSVGEILKYSKGESQVERIKILEKEIESLKKDREDCLGENKEAYEMLEEKYEETITENKYLMNCMHDMKESMENIEKDVDLDLNSVEAREFNVVKDKNKNKITAINRIIKIAIGTKVVEAFFLNNICTKLIYCKDDLPSKIISKYINNKNECIEKAYCYIKNSSEFILGAKEAMKKENKGQFSYIENITKSVLFGENKARDIAKKTIFREKILDIEKSKDRSIEF